MFIFNSCIRRSSLATLLSFLCNLTKGLAPCWKHFSILYVFMSPLWVVECWEESKERSGSKEL